MNVNILGRQILGGALLAALLVAGPARAKDAQEYYAAGVEALEKGAQGGGGLADGDWKDAYKLFNKAIEERKDFAEAYNKRGEASFNLGNYNDALTDFKQATFLNPRLTEAWYHMAWGYEAIHKDVAAIDRYQHAIAVDPVNDTQAVIMSHYRLGLLLKRLELDKKKEVQDFGPAIAELEKASGLDPDFAEAHNELGRLYDLIGRYPEAVLQYNDAIRANATYAEAYSNRGVAYWHDGNWDRALADCQAAIKIDPKFAGGHYNLAEVLYARVEKYAWPSTQDAELVGSHHDEVKKAIDEYSIATQLVLPGDPHRLDYWMGLGKAYYGYHDYDNATLAYKQCLKIKRWYHPAVMGLERIKSDNERFTSHIPKPTPVE